MKGSTLSSVLCTMAFSLGTSLASSSPLEKRNDDAVSVFDPPGLATRVLQCDKNFYTKMDTYATVGHALTSGNGKGRKRWCRSGMCVTFPALFSNKQILFRVQGPYDMFPVNPDGKQYMGGKPGSNFVVFNKEYVVAGVVKKGPLGYSKCLYNDRILPPMTPFMNRMRTKFNEMTRNPFARKNQQDTTTTEPAKSRYSSLNFFARKNQQDTATTEPTESRYSNLNFFARKNQQDATTAEPTKGRYSNLNFFARNKNQEVGAGQQPKESQPNKAPSPAREGEASTSQ